MSGKGVALHNFGRYEEAIVYFDNALEIESDNLNAQKKQNIIVISNGKL